MRAIFFLFPCFLITFFVFYYKGSPDQALKIHHSWQNLSNILPTQGKLLDYEPTGAIFSIGRDFSYSKEQLWKSTFGEYSYDKFLYLPLVWLTTIYLSAQVFVNDDSSLIISFNFWLSFIFSFFFSRIVILSNNSPAEISA